MTALDTGRIILVRIDDRGPFGGGRIIDLSEGAARLLGVSGVARVRVRRITPSDADKAALDAGRPASERLDAPKQLLAALGARLAAQPPPRRLAGPAPPRPYGAEPPPRSPDADYRIPRSLRASRAGTASNAAGVYVQVAALSDRARADRLAAALGGLGPAGVAPAGSLFRVRLGPFASEAAAAPALARVRAQGYRDARIVHDSR